jgi:cell division transport system permease protein
MKGYWYDKAQVAVYLCGEADVDVTANCASGAVSQEQIDAVSAALAAPPLDKYVSKAQFENQDEAYARFKEQFAGDDSLDYVTPDMLNQAYWISLSDSDQAQVIVDSLADMPGVQKVVDQRVFLAPIFTILGVASFTAIAIAALMLVAAALLIATTIRLSAFSRRREISIMRLVGASNRFIQTPFILEGVFAALIGSVLAGVAILAIVKFFVGDYLTGLLTSVSSFVDINDGLLVVPLLIGIGIVLAALSANVAISRYLRV